MPAYPMHTQSLFPQRQGLQFLTEHLPARRPLHLLGEWGETESLATVASNGPTVPAPDGR
jgi:hypothetical protein